MQKAIILNDTRRQRAHIGCNEVMKNLHILCRKHQIDIIASIKSINVLETRLFLKKLDFADLLIINGEGTFHDNKKPALNFLKAAQIAKQRNKIVWLVNTVWQNNHEFTKYLGLLDKISVRESMSFEEIKGYYPAAQIIPDLSLYRADNKTANLIRAKDWIFTDSVDLDTTSVLRQTAKQYSSPFYKMSSKNKLKNALKSPYTAPAYLQSKLTKNLNISDILKAKRVVTGRFHAMLLCAKYGIPFIVIESNTHKVQGVLQDIGFPDHEMYIEKSELTIDELSARMSEFERIWTPEMFSLMEKYTQQANRKLNEIFH